MLSVFATSLSAQTEQKQATVSGGGSTSGPATNGTRKLFSVVGQAVTVQSINAPASFKNGQSGFMQVTNLIINSSTLATEPTAQPTLLSFTNVQSTSLTVGFTAATGSPAGYIVLRKSGSSPTDVPVDAAAYTQGATIGTSIVAYVGNGLTFNETGLTATTQYFYDVFSYNGSGASINYLTSSPLENNTTTTTALATEPTAQPTSLLFTNLLSTSFTVSFTAAIGIPAGYIVLRKTGSSSTDVPVDATAYILGASIGTSTVAYVGSAVTFNETDLTAATQFFYDVFSYNGSGVTINYLAASPLENSVTTLATEPTAQPTSLLFANVQPTSLTASFTVATGSPAGYIVLRKSGSSPTDVPVDATAYAQGGTIGTSTVAHVGSGLTFNETSLTAATQYFYDVFSYNGSGVTLNYLTTSPLEDSRTTLSGSTIEPTTQASNLIITQPFASTLQLTWTNGNGTSRLVVARAVSAVDQAPTDGVTYTASSSFTSGQDLSGGNYVVYNGSGNSVAVTDIQPGTVYHLFVFEYNGTAGLENYKTTNASGNPNSFIPNVIDTTPPVVAHTAAPSAPINVVLNISADITDTESTLTSVVLQWRSVTATTTTFADVTMTKGSGNTWTGQIPSSEMTYLGVEYKIKATNSAALDNTASQTIYRTAILHPATSLLIAPIANLFGREQSKYRMIAIPLSLTSNTVNGIFAAKLGNYDATKWTMYRLNNSSQVPVELNGNSVLVPGEGYWFLSTIKPDISIGDGLTVPTNKPFEIILAPKWNQIGNPYPFKIDWNDVLTELGSDAAKISSKPRKYSGSKDDSQSEIGIFEGAYIENKSTTPITIKIPLKKTLGGRVSTVKQNPLDSDDWQVMFSLTNTNQTFIYGGLGMHRDALTGFDYHDDSAMPPFADYLDIRFDNASTNRVLAKNVVSVTDNYVWEFSVNTNMTDLPSALSWTNDYFGSNDKEIWLLDKQSGEAYDMRKTNTINLRAGLTTSKFKVAVGTHSFVKESTLPDNPLLSISPNPVEDHLSITIALPKKSWVSVDVFDMSGKRLQSFVNGVTEKGRYKFEWDVARQQLGAGLYLVRLQTNDGVKYERIVKY